MYEVSSIWNIRVIERNPNVEIEWYSYFLWEHGETLLETGSSGTIVTITERKAFWKSSFWK
jgi:voltage-gated potassium channel Kch